MDFSYFQQAIVRSSRTLISQGSLIVRVVVFSAMVMSLFGTGIAMAADPEGSITVADCKKISGWARDSDSKRALRIIVYRGADNGPNSTFILAKKASKRLADLPFADKSHGFELGVAGSFRTGNTEKVSIYAEGIDAKGKPDGKYVLLAKSGSPIKCEAATDRSEFVSQDVPGALNTKQKIAVNLTFKNTGTTNWTSKNGVALYYHTLIPAGTFGKSRVTLTRSESIAPGQSKVFSFNVRAPSKEGTFPFEYQLASKANGWFG